MISVPVILCAVYACLVYVDLVVYLYNSPFCVSECFQNIPLLILLFVSDNFKLI
jgi:hypothetical protein